MSVELVRYDTARQALAECVRVDDAKNIRDKAAALAEYARQRDDTEMQTWVMEIYDRACIRIGEISLELEKAEPDRGHGAGLPAGGKTKENALAEAGISTSTAHRYEQLAGGKKPEGQRAAAEAREAYFAESKATGAPPTLEGLRGAVEQAVKETGAKPAKVVSFRSKLDPLAVALTDLNAATSTLVNLSASSLDLDTLVARAHPDLIEWHLTRSRLACTLLTQFVDALERRLGNAA